MRFEPGSSRTAVGRPTTKPPRPDNDSSKGSNNDKGNDKGKGNENHDDNDSSKGSNNDKGKGNDNHHDNGNSKSCNKDDDSNEARALMRMMTIMKRMIMTMTKARAMMMWMTMMNTMTRQGHLKMMARQGQ